LPSGAVIAGLTDEIGRCCPVGVSLSVHHTLYDSHVPLTLGQYSVEAEPKPLLRSAFSADAHATHFGCTASTAKSETSHASYPPSANTLSAGARQPDELGMEMRRAEPWSRGVSLGSGRLQGLLVRAIRCRSCRVLMNVQSLVNDTFYGQNLELYALVGC
jgi:hypothetical protein